MNSVSILYNIYQQTEKNWSEAEVEGCFYAIFMPWNTLAATEEGPDTSGLYQPNFKNTPDLSYTPWT